MVEIFPGPREVRKEGREKTTYQVQKTQERLQHEVRTRAVVRERERHLDDRGCWVPGEEDAAGGEGRCGRRWLSTGKKLRPAELDRELAVDDVLRQTPAYRISRCNKAARASNTAAVKRASAFSETSVVQAQEKASSRCLWPRADVRCCLRLYEEMHRGLTVHFSTHAIWLHSVLLPSVTAGARCAGDPAAAQRQQDWV